jgi:hypothetical protein
MSPLSPAFRRFITILDRERSAPFERAPFPRYAKETHV